MAAQLVGWWEQITSLEFWETLLDSFQILGPAVPILLACIESFIPALPLVAIVTLNVLAHGPLWGFLYSWLGTSLGCTLVFLFFRKVVKRPLGHLADRSARVQKARAWVNQFNPNALFVLAMMPFTPSSFLNFAFGLSDFDAKQYLRTIVIAKMGMIVLLALFGQSLSAALEKPVYILLAALLLAALYLISKQVNKRQGL